MVLRIKNDACFLNVTKVMSPTQHNHMSYKFKSISCDCKSLMSELFIRSYLKNVSPSVIQLPITIIGLNKNVRVNSRK